VRARERQLLLPPALLWSAYPLTRPNRYGDMSLTASASFDNKDPRAAIRAKRRSNSATTSVMSGGYDASRQIEKGSSDEKVSHTARRRDPAMVAGLGIATSSFAQSRTTQSGNAHITTPTYDAGTRARAIQNGTMWNLDGLNYRSPTGLYYNPHNGAMCPGQAAAACF